jgi:hypothetical protein
VAVCLAAYQFTPLMKVEQRVPDHDESGQVEKAVRFNKAAPKSDVLIFCFDDGDRITDLGSLFEHRYRRAVAGF